MSSNQAIQMGQTMNWFVPYHIPSQPLNYEYSPGQNQSTISDFNINYLSPINQKQSVSYSQIDYSNIIEDSEQYSIDSVPLTSSVFLSPQSSYPSSAEQSPQYFSTDESDSSIDNIDLDEIINNGEFLGDQLVEILNEVGCADLLLDDDYELDASCESLSLSSSPKRKYSSDFSDSNSLDSFDSNYSSKTKKVRRSKHTHEERLERKKDQNKKAALRYRHKKKIEEETHEQILEKLTTQKESISNELSKLQTEFNVILPLAKAAFSQNAVKSKLLEEIMCRVNNFKLL